MGKKESLAKFNAKRKRKRAEITEAVKSFRHFVDRGIQDIIMEHGYSGDIGAYTIADGNYTIKLRYDIEPIGEEDSNIVEKYQTKLEEDFIKQHKKKVELIEETLAVESEPALEIVEQDTQPVSDFHDDPDTALKPPVEENTKAELGPEQVEVRPPTPEPPAPIPEPEDEPLPELKTIPVIEMKEPEPVLPKQELDPPKTHIEQRSYLFEDDDEEYAEYMKYREFLKRRREAAKMEVHKPQPPVHHRERREMVRRDTLNYPRDNENTNRFSFVKTDKKSFKFI